MNAITNLAMKITSVSVQVRNPNRVNVSIDGTYRFSLDITQVADLKIKAGREIDDQELAELTSESEYGKLYGRTLEYCLSRPHSVKEVRDYLHRKTREQRYKSRKTGEIKVRVGVSQSIADRVLEKLQAKAYVNDEQFTRWWIETRNQTKGASQRKLRSELMLKGVAGLVIDTQLQRNDRNDKTELQKVLVKKRNKYDDPQKLMQYLARQGFSYDDIKQALDNEESDQ